MNVLRATLLASAAAAALLACSAGDGTSNEPTSEQTDNSQDELRKKKHCVQNVLCVIGDHFDTTLCKCVPNSGGGGVSCGKNTCGAGQYCCNASCGICEHIGAMCPMIACASPN